MLGWGGGVWMGDGKCLDGWCCGFFFCGRVCRNATGMQIPVAWKVAGRLVDPCTACCRVFQLKNMNSYQFATTQASLGTWLVDAKMGSSYLKLSE